MKKKRLLQRVKRLEQENSHLQREYSALLEKYATINPSLLEMFAAVDHPGILGNIASILALNVAGVKHTVRISY